MNNTFRCQLCRMGCSRVMVKHNLFCLKFLQHPNSDSPICIKCFLLLKNDKAKANSCLAQLGYCFSLATWSILKLSIMYIAAYLMVHSRRSMFLHDNVPVYYILVELFFDPLLSDVVSNNNNNCFNWIQWHLLNLFGLFITPRTGILYIPELIKPEMVLIG